MKKDLSLQFFGRLFAIEPTRVKNRKQLWWCHCECGDFVEVQGSNLISGRTKSCGCLQREKSIEVNTTHGAGPKTTSPYNTWSGMRQRCQNKNNPRYARYGGRGIKVCPEWEDYSSFRLWAILHGWHKGLTIDRIDNDKGYSPDNCEFVTVEENNRRQP